MGCHEYDIRLIHQLNQHKISQDMECQKTITEMHVVEKFLSDFGFLSYGRDFVICGRHMFSLQMIVCSETDVKRGIFIDKREYEGKLWEQVEDAFEFVTKEYTSGSEGRRYI